MKTEAELERDKKGGEEGSEKNEQKERASDTLQQGQTNQIYESY
jgi:hypothetical protein